MTAETPTPEKPRTRRRFALSLRALMVLVLIVGGGLGWKVSRAKQQRKAIESLKQLGGVRITFDYQYSGGRPITNGRPWAPAWLRNAVGDEYFQEITGVRFRALRRELEDSDLAGLYGLDRLEMLDLSRIQSPMNEPKDTGVTDVGLAYLERSLSLRKLELGDARITDAGLAKLTWMSNLEELGLGRTKVTASGLAHLQALKNIHKLKLNAASSTDEGLKQVAKLSQLEALTIQGPCQLTDAGLAQLLRLPKLREIEIQFAPLTDESLALLKKLPGLRVLKIIELAGEKPGISDAGLAHIGGMADLECRFGAFKSGPMRNTPSGRVRFLPAVRLHRGSLPSDLPRSEN